MESGYIYRKTDEAFMRLTYIFFEIPFTDDATYLNFYLSFVRYIIDFKLANKK